MKRMRIGSLGLLTGLILGVASGRAAVAQESNAHQMREPFQQQKSVGVMLQNLAARAGIVFVGQVQAIRPNGNMMEIVFSIEKPVIGEMGDTYTVREWSGRWTGGQQHYRVGQRSMIFLYAPNAAGVSSPVDGMAGVVPLVPMGADTDPLLDVRWLATHVQRQVGQPIADADFGAVALADALAIVKGDGGEPQEPVKRPLPVGLRPRPVDTPVDANTYQANLPSILQSQGVNLQQEAGNVEN